MSIRILPFSLILTLLMMTASSCGSNSRPEVSEETEISEDTLSVSEGAQDSPEDEIAEDSPAVQSTVNKNKAPDGPAPDYSALPGPVGFVSDENLIMREKPSAKSNKIATLKMNCLLYTSPSPRDRTRSRMPSSA